MKTGIGGAKNCLIEKDARQYPAGRTTKLKIRTTAVMFDFIFSAPLTRWQSLTE
jgi:hypothetical protein